MTPPPGAVDAPPPRPLRRNREFLLWFGGDVASGIGTSIGQFAHPLIALAVTGSAAQAGVVGIAGAVALLVGMLPGGVVADRYDRRRLRMTGATIAVLTQVVLVVALLTDRADLVVLAAIAAADRLHAGVFGSASGAMLKRLVAPEQLPRAMAADEGRDAAIELGGAPAGGALLALHLALPGVAQSLGHLVSLGCLALMRGDYRPREGTVGHPVADLVEGGRWILRQRLRVQIAASAALINLGSNGALLAVTLMLAADGVSPVRIGLLTTTLGAALLAGTLVAPWLIEHLPTGPLVIGCLTAVAALTAALSWAPGFDVLLVLYAAMGLCIAPLNAAIMGFFVRITPDALQGRAGAITGFLAMALMPLAPAGAGFGLEHLGAGPTLIVFAAVCGLGALALAAGRQARRIPASPRWTEYALAEGLITEDER